MGEGSPIFSWVLKEASGTCGGVGGARIVVTGVGVGRRGGYAKKLRARTMGFAWYCTCIDTSGRFRGAIPRIYQNVVQKNIGEDGPSVG